MSSSSSGLPSISLKKGGNPHPYIAAKRASMRKSARWNAKNSSSGGGTLSPDLITASCDEILLRLTDENSGRGRGSPCSKIISSDSNSPSAAVISIDSNTSIIDCAEDCLNDEDCHDNHGIENDDEDEAADIYSNNPLGNHDDHDAADGDEMTALERTFSDALIIPDPFEREPDDLLSPDTNIHDVNNLIV